MPAAKHPKVERTHVTPRLIVEMIGLNIETVLNWINSGQLKAVNIANTTKRPRWRIAKKDLDAFLESRSNQAERKTKRPVSRPTKSYI